MKGVRLNAVCADCFAGRCPVPSRVFLAGLCPAPARKLFEKSFLDLQKLLEMGVIKPRPSGEVAAARLTERVLCATPLRRTPPPPRRVAPSKENNAAAHSCEHSSRGIISLACPLDKVGGEKVLHTTLETTHSQKDLPKRGRGRRPRRPVQTVIANAI